MRHANLLFVENGIPSRYSRVLLTLYKDTGGQYSVGYLWMKGSETGKIDPFPTGDMSGKTLQYQVWINNGVTPTLAATTDFYYNGVHYQSGNGEEYRELYNDWDSKAGETVEIYCPIDEWPQ